MAGNHKFTAEDDINTMAGPSNEEEPLLVRMGASAKIAASDSSLVTRNEGEKLKQYLGALAACLSAFVTGTTMGWTSAAEKKSKGFPVDDEEFSWVGACLAIGAMIGALPIGSLANTLGRRLISLLLIPITVIGWALLAWAENVWMLYAGRLLLGVIAGGYCIVTPMYTGEIAEKSIRGVLGGFFQLLITLGILFVYVLGAVMESFQWINIICGILPLVYGALFFYFPDTPSWLLSKGRRDAAVSSLTFYRGQHYDINGELRAAEDTLEEERAAKVSFSQAISTKAAKKALMLAMGAMLFQQFSGINAVIFYASKIFEDAGSNIEPATCSVIVGITQVVATYISTLLIERLGRRKLLLISSSVMAVCNIILGVFFYLQYKKTNLDSLGWIPIVSVSVFIALFSIGFGPIPWLYMGEIFPAQVKGVGMSVATITNWLSVFFVTKFYGQVSLQIGPYSTFWIFAGISVAAFIFVSTLFMETRNKSFEEIQAELAGKPHPVPDARHQHQNTDTEGQRF